MVSFRGLVFGRSEYKEENHQNQGMCNLFYEIGWRSGDLKEGVVASLERRNQLFMLLRTNYDGICD